MFSRTGRWFFAGLALAASLSGSVSSAPLGDYWSFDRRYQQFVEAGANLEQALQDLDSHGTSPGGLRAWASGVQRQSFSFGSDIQAVGKEIEYGGNAYKDNLTTPCGSVELKLYGPYGRRFGYQALHAKIQDEIQSIKAAMTKLDARQNDLNHAIFAGKDADRGFPINQWSGATTASLNAVQRAYQTLSRAANETYAEITKLNAMLNGRECQPGKTPASSLPKPGVSTASNAASFTRVDSLTEVVNPYPGIVTVNAAEGSANWDQREGARWNVDFTFKAPSSLTLGQKASLRLGIDVHLVQPEQPMKFYLSGLAPDFAKQLIVSYPGQKNASQTYEVPISPGYKGVKELTVTIEIESLTIRYHYRPAGT